MARTLEELIVLIRGDASGARTELAKTVQHVESFKRRVTQAMGAIGVAFSAAGLVQFARGVVQTTAEFQRLQASLITITGSAQKADAAFAKIRAFASETPFSVREVTEAFIRLKSLGLDAGIDSLRSYGDTASAMGKDVMQFIEAVADASTGEFERLKEFGIRAKTEGDQVTFVFQGIETTVAKTASEIEGYLKGLGEVQFAGAMERQMATLNGALSNLGDAFEAFQFQVGQGGLADAVARAAGNFSALAAGANDTADRIGMALGAAVELLSTALVSTLDLVADLIALLQPLIEGFAATARIIGLVLQELDALGVKLPIIGAAFGLAFGGPIGALIGGVVGGLAQLAANADTSSRAMQAIVGVSDEVDQALADNAVSSRDLAQAYLAQAVGAHTALAAQIALAGGIAKIREEVEAAESLIKTFAENDPLGGGKNPLAVGLAETIKENERALESYEGLGKSIERLQTMLDTDVFQKPQKKTEETAKSASKAADAFEKMLDAVREQTSDLELQAQLIGKTPREIAYATKYQELMNKALGDGVDLTGAMLVEIEGAAAAYADAKVKVEDLTKAQDDAEQASKDAADEAKRRAEEFQREVESVAGSIADDLTTALFEGAETGFDNILENLGTWVRRIGLEILKQQIVLPVTMQLVGAVPGLFGIGGGGVGGALGGAGGNGFNITGALGDTFNQIGSWLGFGANQAAVTASNLAGKYGTVNTVLGTGAGQSGFNNFFGPGFGDYLGDILGAAGQGAGIGALLSSLTGGGSLGGSIGGALGSVAGSFVAGPLGSLVGGALGGLLGGLFGKKKEPLGPQSIFEIRNAGGLGPQQIAATQGAGDPSGFGTSIVDAVEAMVAALGGGLGRGAVTVDVGQVDKYGGIYVNPTGYYGDRASGVQDSATFFGQDAEAARRFAISTILGQAGTEGIAAEAVAALRKSLAIRDDDTEVEKDLGVIKLLFDELPDDMGDAERALRDLNEAMDDAAKRARELGLAEADVEAKRAQAIEDLKSGFLTSLEDQILSLKDPVAFAIQELDKWKEAMIADAEALGVGLAQVEELYALRRQEILERIGQQTVDSLQKFLEQITFGNLSGASPEATMEGSRAAFEAAAAQAMAGDAEARARIEELGAQFLEASRSFNASGASFYSDRQRVEDVVRALLDGLPGYASGTMSAPGGWSWVGERGKELMFTPPGAAILPNAMSTMMAGGFANDGAAGRDLLRVASQILASNQRMEADIAALKESQARQESKVMRLWSKAEAA